MTSLTIGRSTRTNGRKRHMARRPRGHEKIWMEKRRFSYFPEQFTWRGRQYHVRAVERCWTVSRRRLGHKVERLCFRVRVGAVRGREGDASRPALEGTLDVYQNLSTNAWHLEKVVSRA